MRRLRVLLVNPPIFDFTAYDFWLRPYGMLRVAGRIRQSCDLRFFDFLGVIRRDAWGRGRFESQDIPRPKSLRDIPRKFRRFGRPRAEFRDFLRSHSLDAVLVQTVMTYWYPGVLEVLEDVRELQPGAKIVLGGVYATLCPSHARSLGPDLVIEGSELGPLWRLPFDCTGGGIAPMAIGIRGSRGNEDFGRMPIPVHLLLRCPVLAPV